MNLRPAITLLCLAAIVLSACSTWRPTTVPIRTLTDPARCATPVDTLVVLLPGSYSLPEDFTREGFIRTMRERQWAADVVLADAHVGYYNKRTIIDRLQADVIQPARAKGYRHIWLAGISLGGVGSMLYADEHPEDVDGIAIIAPYLGSRLTAKEIVVAGGLANWRVPEVPRQSDIDVTLWSFLKKQTGESTAGKKLPIYLGYGLNDRFVYSQEVLRRYLPASNTFTAEGDHDWPAWRVVWKQMVEAIPIRRDASCRAE